MVNTRNIRPRRDEEEVDELEEPIYVCAITVCTNTKYHTIGVGCAL